MVLTEEFVKKIELNYLHLLRDLLKERKISLKMAKASAQLMLTYLPFHDSEDIKHKLDNFKAIYPALTPLHTYLIHELEVENTKEVLEKMRHLMKNEDIDSALQLSHNP